MFGEFQNKKEDICMYRVFASLEELHQLLKYSLYVIQRKNNL